jgi:predicted secreted hydrolase
LNKQRIKLLAASMAILLAVVCGPINALARTFKLALPGYTFSFPRDHASHDEYKTEWWYYTGHLQTDDGKRFGYELTFFRLAMDVPDGIKDMPWNVDNVYMAHFAVSDLSNQRFFHQQRLTRPGLNAAGAEQSRYHVFNENWSAQQSGDKQLPTAKSADYAIDLTLTPAKPPVIHGENGVSQKAACRGCASHYYSFTRLLTDGYITAQGKRLHVTGVTWMDHEFGSNQLTPEQVGWDWFSIQLDDQTEIMLYVMRLKKNSLDPHSSGTFIDAHGSAEHLNLADYSIEQTASWRSPATGGVYPMGWHVRIPKRKLDITIAPELKDQELVKQSDRDVTYWEGACRVNGTNNGKDISGQAYVEMTGYAAAFSKNI